MDSKEKIRYLEKDNLSKWRLDSIGEVRGNELYNSKLNK